MSAAPAAVGYNGYGSPSLWATRAGTAVAGRAEVDRHDREDKVRCPSCGSTLAEDHGVLNVSKFKVRAGKDKRDRTITYIPIGYRCECGHSWLSLGAALLVPAGPITPGDLLDAYAAFQSSHDAILYKNLDGIIKAWNVGCTELYGYTGAEVIGRHVSILSPTGDRAEFDELLARVARGERIERYRTTRRTKDGRVILVELSVSPMHNYKGEISGAQATAHPVQPALPGWEGGASLGPACEPASNVA